MPLSKLLKNQTGNRFGNMLDELIRALTEARSNTANKRKYNREKLARRANVRDLRIGDMVIVKTEERLTHI